MLCYSHIIPELCYLDTYDSKHRTTKIQVAPAAKKPIQKGFREYLLCKDCEGKLNKWETHFKKFWYNTPALPQVVSDRYVVVSGIDYKLVKLFHLSIFWRASVATIPEFDTVSLGSEEEAIRRMLESEDPGPEDRYPITGRILTGDQREVVYGLVGKPQRAEYEGIDVYYAPYAGAEWTLFVGDGTSPGVQSILDFALKASGEMYLAAVPVMQSNCAQVFAEQQRNETNDHGPNPASGGKV